MASNPNGGPKDIDEFTELFKEIEEKGFIHSHRQNDTGIGKTLEDLLGIEENDNQAPDFADYELKTRRLNGSNSMTTLFTKSPDIKGSNSRLREEYGYMRDGTKEIHCTIQYGKETPIPNGKGTKLGMEFVGSRLYLTTNGKPIEYAYYELSSLEKSLESKYISGKAVFVGAISRGPRTDEEFHYVQASEARGLDIDNFIKLVKEGVIRFDLRLGAYPDGRVHDHGSGFRIYPKDERLLFDELKILVDKYTSKL